MSRIILLGCRSCEGEIRFSPADVDRVQCPHCQIYVPVRVDHSLLHDGLIRNCIGCGHDTLYIQKDFNRALGLSIVVSGSLASVFFFYRGESLAAMLALGVMALVDLLIYSMVGEVTVCYACHTIYRGFHKNPEHETFDLKNLEKYGGRDPRF
jgi:hypothetical protein